MSHRWSLLLAPLLLWACGPAEPPPPPQSPPSDAELIAARPFAVEVPRAYAKGVATPLVVLLHGYGASGAAVEAWYRFQAIQDEGAGFLYVHPDGTPDRTGSRNWNYSPVHSYPFDVDYLRALIDDVKARYSVDPRRVFVVGVSAGGHMAHRAGCELSSRVAAVISVAGQVLKNPEACAPTARVSALQVHGDADRVIPYDGDPDDPTQPSAKESIAVWARNNGCTGPLAPTGQRLDLVRDVDGDEAVVAAHGGCPAGIGVELWTLAGAGHHPDVQPGWAAQLYGFLAAHPRD